MELKWKDIYNNNQARRFSEITGVKQEDVELESNSFNFLKEKTYIVIIIALLFLGLIFYTFKYNIKIFLMVLAFFAIAGVCFFYFNYFKLKAQKEGLYVKFGIQKGVFSYEKIKSVYLSKYNDNSFLIPSKTYNIVIRYIDGINRIRELSFPNYFLKKEDTVKFLENFEIKEAENEKFVAYEKYKLFKRIGKTVLIVLFILFIIGVVLF